MATLDQKIESLLVPLPHPYQWGWEVHDNYIVIRTLRKGWWILPDRMDREATIFRTKGLEDFVMLLVEAAIREMAGECA